MGGSVSTLNPQDNKIITDLTGFDVYAIRRLQTDFKSLDPQIKDVTLETTVHRSAVMNYKLFRNCPFRESLIDMFCSTDHVMAFVEFIDLMWAMSMKCAVEVKIAYCFVLFDTDKDGLLGFEDVKSYIEKITCTNTKVLSDDDVKTIVDEILMREDLDSDGYISFSEFRHFLLKVPEFAENFSIV